MSIYDELKNADLESRKLFRRYEERVRQGIVSVVLGFKRHCEIPDGAIRYLKGEMINGEMTFTENGPGCVLPSAMTFNDADGFWYLRVRVILSRLGVSPERYFSFAVGMTVKDGNLVARWPNKEVKQLDPSNEGQLRQYFDTVVSEMTRFFAMDPIVSETRGGVTDERRRIPGFDVGGPHDPGTE
jgi:hypothetical protein